MEKYCIALLGGIGPAATGVFYNLLIDTLQKSDRIESNEDFPHIIINSIPAPELTSTAIADADIGPYIEGVKLLNRYRPDVIFMICNTIHLYFKEIQNRSGAKNLFSLRDVVQKKLEQRYQKRKSHSALL